MELERYIRDFKAGDYSCFDEFYKRTSRQVYFAALGILKDRAIAEDILQETYVAFINGIARCRQNENIIAYLTVIARNKSINYVKRESRNVYSEETLNNISCDFDDGDLGIEWILAELNERLEREIVVYHVLLGYKFKEIADIVGEPLGTVLWRYNRAMKILREKVGKFYE